MDANAALDDALDDALDLMGKWIVVVHDVTRDISNIESVKPLSRPKRDTAISRWVIYLGVMLAQIAEGVSCLARESNVRSMLILMRSMFEYQQKAQFFCSHRDEAFDQFGSIGARRYDAFAKLAHPNPQMSIFLVHEYLKWKKTSGNRDEWSGKVAMLRMHLENTSASSVKTDKNGTRYTEEFQTAYGIPSLYVHGEPILMPEVFPNMEDISNWEVRETPIYFDSLTAANAANTMLLNFCVKTSQHYALDNKRIYALRTQVARVINATAALHGNTFTVSVPTDDAQPGGNT